MRGKRTIFVSCSRVWKNENVDVVSRVLEQGKKLQNLMQKDRERKSTPFLGQRVRIAQQKAQERRGTRYGYRMSAFCPPPKVESFRIR